MEQRCTKFHRCYNEWRIQPNDAHETHDANNTYPHLGQSIHTTMFKATRPTAIATVKYKALSNIRHVSARLSARKQGRGRATWVTLIGTVLSVPGNGATGRHVCMLHATANAATAHKVILNILTNALPTPNHHEVEKFSGSLSDDPTHSMTLPVASSNASNTINCWLSRCHRLVCSLPAHITQLHNTSRPGTHTLHVMYSMTPATRITPLHAQGWRVQGWLAVYMSKVPLLASVISGSTQ